MASTTSGALTGSYTKSDTTAFSVLLNPNGPDYINGNSTATSSVAATSTSLQVNGNFVVSGSGDNDQLLRGNSRSDLLQHLQQPRVGMYGTSWTKIF